MYMHSGSFEKSSSQISAFQSEMREERLYQDRKYTWPFRQQWRNANIRLRAGRHDHSLLDKFVILP
jgi:hypothetical protein